MPDNEIQDPQLNKFMGWALLGCTQSHVKAHETLSKGKVESCLLCEAWYSSRELANRMALEAAPEPDDLT